MQHVPNDRPAEAPGFVRQDAQAKVFAVFSLSAKPRRVRFEQALFHGRYTEHFGGGSATLDASTLPELAPCAYRA